MTFLDDMRSMTAGEVREALRGRLLNGAGQPWNESRGEPVWGLLVSAFHHWRLEEEKLAAVDGVLNELVPEAFESDQWLLARDSCEFISALVGLPESWQPTGSASWPFKQWLMKPCVPSEKTDASVAALRLMCQLGLADDLWLREAFAAGRQAARQDAGRPHLRWLQECWKALLTRPIPDSGRGASLPWFDLLSVLSRLRDENTRRSQVESALDWAWSVRVNDRPNMASAALKAVLDLDSGAVQDAFFELIRETFESEEPVVNCIGPVRHMHEFSAKKNSKPSEFLRNKDPKYANRWSPVGLPAQQNKAA